MFGISAVEGYVARRIGANQEIMLPVSRTGEDGW